VPRRRLRPLIALLCLPALLAGLVACGGSGSGDSAEQVLEQTFGGGKSIHSAKLNLALNVNLRGLPQLKGPILLRVTGPFHRPGAKAAPRFDLALVASLAGQQLTAGAISVGDRGFLRLQGQTYAVPDSILRQFNKGFERASGGKGKKTTFASLGIDPRRWLRNPRTVGAESVGGVNSTHVASDIDVGRFLEDLNRILARAGSLGAGKVTTRLTPSQRQSITRAIKSAKFDVWSGRDDRIMRRLELHIRFGIAPDKRAGAGGLESGDVAFSLELDDVNAPQRITAPRGAKPLTELTKGLKSLGLGLNPGGSGSSGSGTSGSGSSGASEFESYSRCLAQAGSDIARAQKCADLLNP
jgi:hypothetical protein